MSRMSADEVIDLTIGENRFGERFCYGLIVVFVSVGVGVVINGALRQEPFTVLVGTISSSLFWPAFSKAREIRRENIAIRLLAAALNKAETAEQAARAINDAFISTFVKSNRENRGKGT